MLRYKQNGRKLQDGIDFANECLYNRQLMSHWWQSEEPRAYIIAIGLTILTLTVLALS